MTNKLNLNNLTKSEEDYLKAIFQLLIEDASVKVGNNQLADYLKVSPASTNNMIKKLKTKGYVVSEKYGKLELTEEGKSVAVRLIRKHRLWETFLCNYLNFTWDEVHDVAEQLEHIKSRKLIDELDRFMDFPKKDPHGEVIPNANGEYSIIPKITLSSLSEGDVCQLIAVNDGSVHFLKYVSEIGLALSSEIQILEVREFDKSIRIKFDNTIETVTRKFADNVFVNKVV
ncbi:DtxR family Mn-dependent transcriptional regulator [Aquimarina sp. EL_43]|uniref:metal-dependent transcriptional regulator n=1 Tax=unclassified Aquimarina TaxID=2627091 RepID=UPI0018C972BF|nr:MULTISPECIES: metal-dependent transcriptional regulator [unclassified Aquimarina]MBG6132416.1 DtxR family Mn-dependent transcriptional regulator [Aquimarina sp. EL_35]MBG6152547.1 DtxR family Mn-dependent transcriptional regulator [Aquimarina sp. EL_32]MBG6170526.1 DtxR family Mn-dependent transcriptional regulator [Aquimarina sp. EL_43]